MSKYQDALNKIVKSCCPNCIDENGCSSCDIEKICNATAKSWVNTLQELVDKEKTYTEEQIKTILEAWEVVKLKEVDLYDVIHTTNYKQYKSENVDLLKQYFLTQQEYEIIKKAWEAEDV